MNRCPPGVDSSFFSIPVLPGQRRQRHDPSRSFPVDLRCQHGSTRFTQVGLTFPVLQGSPRLFLTCQKPPERPPVHPGPSGIIPVHHGGLRFNPRYSPVHPGPWTGVNRGVPGAQWDWGIKPCAHGRIRTSGHRDSGGIKVAYHSRVRQRPIETRCQNKK